MADRTINARLRSRIDTEANWTSANPVLLEGELGIATNGSTLRAKVGDGVTAWNSLVWLQAPASDVSAWAKSATKPSYTAAEVGAASVADLEGKLSLSGGTMTGNAVMKTGTDYTTGRARNIVLQTGTPTVSASNNGWIYGIYQ